MSTEASYTTLTLASHGHSAICFRQWRGHHPYSLVERRQTSAAAALKNVLDAEIGASQPVCKVRARSFRVKPRDAEEILYEKALEATVSPAELVVCGEFEITQSLLKYDESSTPANTAFCGGRAKRWVAVTTTN